ncbi:hypothetical protein NV226_01725 [Mycoplasma iguanae]|uniref:Uncharacterized protein n=1 Tax=Mycoplasma iguanae TaxID=292461 RepID=A0ABY5R9Z2_9MOLU|nr:hypothetical protein [Mycoplasma iguanae]UVD81435.1 hypothetical protein NV226_01725 [Mycoplasma iguanae]
MKKIKFKLQPIQQKFLLLILIIVSLIFLLIAIAFIVKGQADYNLFIEAHNNSKEIETGIPGFTIYGYVFLVLGLLLAIASSFLGYSIKKSK